MLSNPEHPGKEMRAQLMALNLDERHQKMVDDLLEGYAQEVAELQTAVPSEKTDAKQKALAETRMRAAFETLGFKTWWRLKEVLGPVQERALYERWQTTQGMQS